MCNTRVSIESLQASLSRITPIPRGRVSVLPEDEINDDDPAETPVDDEARDPDNKDEDEDDSTSPEGEHHPVRDDVFSKISEDTQMEMLEQNWMLLYLLLEQQAEWREERTRMLTELDCSSTIDKLQNPRNQSKIFKVLDPLGYCGAAIELDEFLKTLRAHFVCHRHQFPRGDPDQVKYAVSCLDTWNNHPDMTRRQTEDMDPSEWASDQSEAKDQCLKNLELFPHDLRQMNGDTDRSVNSAAKAIQEYQQLPNESVQIYTNRLKANWRTAGRNLISQKVFLYDMAWAGLLHVLKTKGRPSISSGKIIFDKLNPLLDCAAASVFKPDEKTPGAQQQQQRQVCDHNSESPMRSIRISKEVCEE